MRDRPDGMDARELNPELQDGPRQHGLSGWRQQLDARGESRRFLEEEARLFAVDESVAFLRDEWQERQQEPGWDEAGALHLAYASVIHERTRHETQGAGAREDLASGSRWTFSLPGSQPGRPSLLLRNLDGPYLVDELRSAERGREVPVDGKDTRRLAALVADGDPVKWALNVDGTLHFARTAITHAVLFRGGPVVAAGEADLVFAKGRAIVLRISNTSGHYRPPASTLAPAIAAFESHGFVVPPTSVEEHT